MKKLIGSLMAIVFFVSIPYVIVTAGSEMDDAVTRLYQNGLTMYTNVNDFMANKNIRRDEASKFFSQFAINVLKNTTRVTTPMCGKLSDVTMQNTMRSFVVDSCVLGYMQGSNGKFNPSGSLSNEQAIAVVIRILEGRKDESGTRRSDEYYQRADELGLLTYLSLSNRTTSITRGKLGILLYRAALLVDADTTDYVSTKPDLIITSVGLNPSYPAPKMGDSKIYVTYTIKNIGRTINFSPAATLKSTCNGTPGENITDRILHTDGSLTITQAVNFEIDSVRFPTSETTFPISCNINIQSSTVFESNENNNSKSFFLSIGNTVSSKPDFIINSISLDTNYPAPKVDDPNVYLKFSIKNIGGSLVLSSAKKIILSCSNNSTTIVNKNIVVGTLDTNGILTIEGVTNVINPSTYLFPSADAHYTLNCSITFISQTTQESDINNNSKNFSFPVATNVPLGGSTNGSDIIIDSMHINTYYSSYYGTSYRNEFIIKNIGDENINSSLSMSCVYINNDRKHTYAESIVLTPGGTIELYNEQYSADKNVILRGKCAVWGNDDITTNNSILFTGNSLTNSFVMSYYPYDDNLLVY